MTHASRRHEPARSNAREQLPRALVGRRRPTFLEHDIAAAPQAAHYYRPSQGQNRCAMEIDGERVLVDVSTFTNMKNERAVVLRHDGSIGIELVSTEDDYPRPYGTRSAFGQSYRSPHGGTMRDCLTVVGKVIDPEIFHGVTIDGEPS
ncbi:hypothetical protein [Agrobacterium sp. YIC 4121]|uniref:hypothetical protein n=1 Tax=Agrobacterium sp. YIC 4121 TaxID=1923829 RepID=UPI00098FA4CF|nr:hypothetical protein [Agrobacterium sp. YIC 4121]OOO25581.1 hypothetical protein BTE54_23485 [Agrobacterium sp. YIC 4121]